MWVLGERAERFLLEHGLFQAKPGVACEARLCLTVEPVECRIALSVRNASGDPSAAPAVAVDPRFGLWDSHVREILVKAGFRSWLKAAPPLVRCLWEAFLACELLLLDVGVAMADGELRFTEGQVLGDDNALFRNGRLERLWGENVPEPVRRMKAHGIDYVELQGAVGLLCVGAGETMAVMDLLEAGGAKAACFLDCSGGFGPEAIEAALRQIASLPAVRVVLVNIFGGVTRVDRLAESIMSALDRIPGFSIPMVVRLEGTEAARGRELLARRGFDCQLVLRDAIDAALALAKGGTA